MRTRTATPTAPTRTSRLAAVPLTLLLILGLLGLPPVAGLGGMPSAGADPDEPPAEVPEVIRTDGEDRYATAAATARATYPAARTVVLVSGEGFADALAGAALAGARIAPILLTRPDRLPGATGDALEDLGAQTVVVLGGEDAIGEAVIDALEARDLTVERIAGANRYQTAAAAARAAAEARDGLIGRIDGDATVLLASGTAFPDALAAGPLAYAAGLPILLTDPGVLPSVTAEVIRDLDVDQVVVLGGSAAVSSAVRAEVDGLGVATTRLAGPDRAGTAAQIAGFALDAGLLSATQIGLATGADAFGGADALAAAALLGLFEAPLLLTGSLPEPTRALLARRGAATDTLQVFGGTAAVSAATVRAAVDAVAEPEFTVDLSWINATDGAAFYRGQPDAFGSATLAFDRAANRIAYTIDVTEVTGGFAGAGGVGLHRAGLAEPAGQPLLTFADGARLDAGNGRVTGEVSAGAVDGGVGAILAAPEDFTVTVARPGQPDGAVRGQLPAGGQDRIVREPVTMEVTLAPDGVVTDDGVGVDSDAAGVLFMSFFPDRGRLAYEGQLTLGGDDAFDAAAGAQLRRGRLDERGTLVAVLTSAAQLEASGGRIQGVLEADDLDGVETLADLLRDPSGFAVTVASGAYPDGVARGQLPDGGQARLPAP